MTATRTISLGGTRSSGPLATRASGPAASWVWCGALALYGTLRWGTMLPGRYEGRMFLSLLVAAIVAVTLRHLPAGRPRRWAVAPLLLVGVTLELAAAGFRLTWHLGRLQSHVAGGISSLSGVLVPYAGSDSRTIAVIVLGAGLLLLCGGAIFGTVRERPGTGRLALAALPLLAVAVVPSTIVTPHVAYLHGLVTFVLGALLVFSTRPLPERRVGAAALLAAAAVIGAVGAGLVAGDTVWLQVATGTRVITGTSGGSDVFDWRQTYGALTWPHGGATVLSVSAPRAAHWKAENLDDFNGVSWSPNGGAGSGSAGGAVGDTGLSGVSAAHLAAYTETLKISVGQMTSRLIIAAGYAATPDVIGATPNVDAGTWVTDTPIVNGQNYQVNAYVPDPSARQLAAAGTDYPATVAQFRRLGPLPSAYDGVEALSRRLAAGTRTPDGYVEAVLGYLRRGFTYTLNPPAGGRYPLASFLLDSHSGYCQAFAGAMALLLRMHDIPARVAVGFSPGTRQARTDTYNVTDKDAHAWVEAWFPSFGWVTFDPTPGTAVTGTSAAGLDTTGGQSSTPVDKGVRGPNLAASLAQAARERLARQDGSHGSGGHRTGRRGSSTLATIVLSILGALGLGLLGLLGRRFAHRPSTSELTTELERAFARCGRPLGSEVTFTVLARRLSDNPRAAGYVAALGTTRYGREAGAPTARGRAALRHWLAADLGLRGWTRAMRALPPRRPPAGAR